MEPLAFDNVPALKSFDQVIYPSFLQFEAVQFKSGIKSDLWFRFIENSYVRKDKWWWKEIKKDIFPSIYLTYRNYITIPDEEEELNKNRIARFIYRNAENSRVHEREVIQFEDFLGGIAGLFDLIILFVMFFLGDYIDFLSKVRWIKKFYRFKDCNDEDPNSPMLNAS